MRNLKSLLILRKNITDEVYEHIGYEPTSMYHETSQSHSLLENKVLLNVKEMCDYLSVDQTKCRELLADPAHGFTVQIGNQLYAHRKNLDK